MAAQATPTALRPTQMAVLIEVHLIARTPIALMNLLGLNSLLYGTVSAKITGGP